VENKKSLQPCALFSHLSDAVENKVHDFFAYGVVATGIVVGCILFTTDQLIWMK
jgi:hypothetical protein